MSVFTPVSRAQLTEFLDPFPVGELTEFAAIEAGIENSNYFVTTTTGEFVLTLFERVSPRDIPYFLQLTTYLADRGLPCARPVANANGQQLHRLNGKPTALVPRLPGHSILDPDPHHCRSVGRVLAQMHAVSVDFPIARANPYGIEWMRRTADAVLPRIDDSAAQALLRKVLDEQSELDLTSLAVGTVHTDLFRDNVLFNSDVISGVIDFYYACTDCLVLDLATALNDWCTDTEGNVTSSHADALLEGYRSVRELSAAEQAAWPVMLRRSALRFWLSRLYDSLFPRQGEMVQIKDPRPYQRILNTHSVGDGKR